MEHYRAGFHNRAMFVAPIVAAAALATTSRAAFRQDAPANVGKVVLGASVLTGLIGFGFHLLNISRRTGGLSSGNLFFGAPVAAPLAITMAGTLGLLAPGTTGRRNDGVDPGDASRNRPATFLSTLSAIGLVGTSLEAGALHFRGAFQNPFMYAPVAVPPLAAVTLATAAVTHTSRARRVARTLLGLTAWLGVVGVAFHTWGVERRMGGWRNWRQNLLVGPLPAPPAFTGLALAGLAALDLSQSRRAR